jgi:hypothetical protein
MTKRSGTDRHSDDAFSAAMSRRAVLRAGAATAIAATGVGRVGSAFANSAIVPFTYHAPESALDDLRQRLAQARWPEREPVGD